MKMFNIAAVLLIILSVQFAYAQEDKSNDWITHWSKGIKLFQESKYEESISEYNKAIDLIEKKDIPIHLFLYIERGNALNKAGSYKNAIKDFSLVIENEKATDEDLANALAERSLSYAKLGMKEECLEDGKRSEKLRPSITNSEIFNDYMVFKLGSSFNNDSELREYFLKTMMLNKTIDSESDVIFSPSGMIILKKSKHYKGLQSNNPE